MKKQKINLKRRRRKMGGKKGWGVGGGVSFISSL